MCIVKSAYTYNITSEKKNKRLQNLAPHVDVLVHLHTHTNKP